ncbi:MAG: thioredoxin domain-containing protein [bacterium]|nr:thioredoxin domain-containing protein [bacterium]
MEQKNSLTIPAAIIIAGALIALALIFIKVSPNTNRPADTKNTASQTDKPNISPVTSDDHLLGNPDAKIIVVEYSDPSCPFCKSFHKTMQTVMDEYGKTGKVALVYRHFITVAVDDLGREYHKNASNEAHAFECAGSVGGNDKFFEFADKFYDLTPSVTGATPEGFDQSKLPEVAKSVGIDVDAFNSCMASGKFKQKIITQHEDGIKAGVAGTPYSFLVTKSGTIVPINGAYPITQMKKAIDALLVE